MPCTMPVPRKFMFTVVRPSAPNVAGRSSEFVGQRPAASGAPSCGRADDLQLMANGMGSSKSMRLSVVGRALTLAFVVGPTSSQWNAVTAAPVRP